MKYKPCCGMRCMMGGCKTRAQGGCYCVCRLKDAIDALKEDKYAYPKRLKELENLLKTYET